MNPDHSETSGANPHDGDEVSRALSALLAVRTWDDMYTLLQREQTLLLSDAIVQRFASALERAHEEQNEYVYNRLEPLHKLLRRSREIGIDQAMEEFGMPLVETNVSDPQAVFDTFRELHEAVSLHGQWWTRYRKARAILERERALLLTDTADRVVAFFEEGMPEKQGWGMGIDEDTRTKLYAPYRTLFRRARQVGVNKAWEEFVKVDSGKDWRWVNFSELFEEWIYGTVYDEDDESRWGSAVYQGYRQGRHFLEAHLELLNPELFEAPLDAEITAIEEYIETYEENFEDKTFTHPSLQSEDRPFPPPVYMNSRERIFGLLEGQMLLRDAYARGGTPEAVRDAYTNAYGGFALDLPPWVEDVLEQIDTFQQSEENHETRATRASLLRAAFIRAHEDPDVVPEIMVEFGRHFLETCKDDPHLDAWSVQQSQIELYTAFLAIYSRERYPYQWALIQKELGDVYAQRARLGSTDDHERFIQYYDAALQEITRRISHKSWDLTEHNKDWAVMQNRLGLAYSERVSGDRRDNLTRAVECHRVALSVYTQEASLFAHRDIQLYLAFLYCQEWVAEAAQRADESGILEAYRHAHEAFDTARRAHLELGWREYYSQNRVKHVVTWPGVRTMYAYDAWCLWQQGDLRAAVVALEDGRAQALTQAQAIAGTVLDGLCEYHMQQFIEVRQKWDKELAEGTIDSIRTARQNFLLLRDAIREHCKPDFLPEQPTYRDIARAAPDHALVYITAMEQGGVALVVPPAKGGSDADDREPFAISLPKLTWQRIRDWLLRPDEERQRIVGGYQFALQHRGIELLRKWVDSTGHEQQQERRLAMPLCDLPTAISAPYTTLQAAMGNVVETWRAEADHLSRQPHVTTQEKARELHARLTLPLQEALEKNVLVADLNWFLLEAELERLQQDFSETFVADLRRELDHLGLGDPNQPVALVPCGQLGMLPIHAAWARRNQSTGERIPLLETCELTYQASARSLATARKALAGLPKQGPIVAVGNPRPTDEAELHWAEAEAQAIVALARRHKRVGCEVIVKEAATLSKIQAILQAFREKPSGAWIQMASHGNADPTDPTNCYMLLSHNEKLTLADLQRQRLLEHRSSSREGD